MDKQIKSFHITISGDLEAHAQNEHDAISIELMTDTNPRDAYFRDLTNHTLHGDAAMRILRHLYPALEAEIKEQAGRVMGAVERGTEPVTQEELFKHSPGEEIPTKADDLAANTQRGYIMPVDMDAGISVTPRRPSWFSRDLLRVVLNIDPPGDSYPGPVRANALMNVFSAKDEGWADGHGIVWSDEAETLHREGVFKSAIAHDVLMELLLESEPSGTRPDLGLRPEPDETIGEAIENSRSKILKAGREAVNDIAKLVGELKREPDDCPCPACSLRRDLMAVFADKQTKH